MTILSNQWLWMDMGNCWWGQTMDCTYTEKIHLYSISCMIRGTSSHCPTTLYGLFMRIVNGISGWGRTMAYPWHVVKRHYAMFPYRGLPGRGKETSFIPCCVMCMVIFGLGEQMDLSVSRFLRRKGRKAGCRERAGMLPGTRWEIRIFLWPITGYDSCMKTGTDTFGW